MAIEDVGVRFVAEGAPQFEATLKRTDKAVENFGDSANKASKSVETSWSKLEKTMSSPEFTRFALGAATAVAGALVGIGAAVKKLADDYMGYAFQVKDFGRIIGATPQEASKLIQVADDVRLSVGSMTIAMRTAITKGYTPTVEGLGRMSDAYLQIQDPLQRSKFLIETFGRSGLEMAKLMELGSEKIKAMGDSIEGTGRLMTTEGIQKAQAYYNALDNLGDSIAGVTLTLGSKFTPAITDTANGLTQIVDDGIGVIDMFISMGEWANVAGVGLVEFNKIVNRAFFDYMTAAKSAEEITDEFRKKTQEARDAEWTFTDSLLRNPPAAKAAADSVEDLTEKLAKLTETALNTSIQSGLSGTLTSSLKTYQGVLNDTAPKMFDLEKRLKFLDVNGWIPNAKSVDDLTKKLREQNKGMSEDDAKRQAQIMLLASHNKQLANTKQAIADLKAQQDAAAEAMRKATAEMIYQQASAGLDAAASLALAKSMGLISEKDFAVSTAIQNLKLSYDANADGAISASEGAAQFASNVDLIFQAVSDLESKNIPITIDNIKKKIQELSNQKVEIKSEIAPPTVADIRAFDAVNTSTTNLATSISGVANAMTINQATFSGWTNTTGELGEKTDVAQKMTEFLRVKMENTGKSAGLNMDKLTGWKDTVDEIGTKSHEAASFAVDLNQQLKNIPAKITVDIYIQTHGTIPSIGTSKETPGPNPGKHASGGPTYANTLYLVGERGPELFVPFSSGYMIPNNQTQSILNIIPMAAGGKMTSKQEKEHNKKVKAQRKPPKQTGNAAEGGDINGDTSDLSTAYDYAVSLLQSSVAEYNYLLKHGASKTVLAEKKASIDILGRQVTELTRLKQIDELRKAAEDTGSDLPTGIADAIPWLDKIIEEFRDLFGLLNSSTATNAMSNIAPLVSSSPAPLAIGLSQIKRQMDKLSMTALPNFYGSVAQLAGQNYYQNSSATYNINVPVTATVNNGTDISRIAYAVAKEIAANVRS